jgi:hypothetical protein
VGAPKHLFIGIPSRDGRLSAALHRWISAFAVMGATGQVPFRVTEFIAEGYSPVHYARNVVTAAALKTDADRIVMIDDDMLPDGTCWKVLNSAADICVPRMFRFRHNGDIAMSEEENRPPEIATCATLVSGEGESEKRLDIVPEYGEDAEMQVHAAGTGFISINRAVLDDPRMHVGEADADGVPAIFQMISLPNGRITEWEDVDFTLRAHRLGYTVSAHFGAHCGHRKSINLDAVYEMVYGAPRPQETVVGVR